MLDSEEDIKRKIKKAYCPTGQVEENPILEYCKYILFEKFDKLEITRPEKFGGNLIIKNYKELEELYKKEKIHPLDLKTCTASYLNKLLEPVRKKIHGNKKVMKLYKEIQTFQVTR